MYNDKPMQEFIKAEIEKKQWVFKVLSGEKEADLVIHRNDEFVILPDNEGIDEPGVLSWIVILTDTNLKSLRELRGEHIPMLKSVQDMVGSLLPQECSSPMLYWHFPPSVWVSHLHVCSHCDILRTTSSMQRVHFLHDVISNLSIDSNFYAKATLTYILPSSHEITQLHKARVQSGDITCRG